MTRTWRPFWVLWAGALILLGLGAPGAEPRWVPVPAAAPELLWSGERRLSWEDFWADPPPAPLRGDEVARIWVGLSYSATWEVSYDPARHEWTARLVSASTQAFMDRSRSWVLPDQRHPEVLRHEQGHFDLLEVFRRLLEREFQRGLGRVVGGATREAAERNLAGFLEDVYQRVWQAHEAFQAQYDRETQNGQNRREQERWIACILQWLEDPLRVQFPLK